MKILSRIFELLKNWPILLATGFGSGLLPVIPGTIGSLFSIPFWLIMYWLLPNWLCWVVICFSFIFGIIICKKTLNYRFNHNNHHHDHGSIVWDEFVGMWITLMRVPIVNVNWVFISFIIFRFFDMLKPWPISWFDQKINGSLGIMLDDTIAAIFASLTILIISHIYL